MSSYATTSGIGPFKPVIVIGDNFYEGEEFKNDEDALIYAETIFHIICENEKQTLKRYKFESVDK